MKTISYLAVLFLFGFLIYSEPKVTKIKFKPLKTYSKQISKEQMELDLKIFKIANNNRAICKEIYKKDTMQ